MVSREGWLKEENRVKRKHEQDGESIGWKEGQGVGIGREGINGGRNFGACVCVCACELERQAVRLKVHRSFHRLSKRDSRHVRYTIRAQLLVRGYGVGVSVSRARPQKSVYVRAQLRGLTAVRVAGLLLVRATTNAEFCPWNIFERKGRTEEKKEERKKRQKRRQKRDRKKKNSKHFHETESLSVAPPSRPSIKIGGPKPRKVDSSIVQKRSERYSFPLIFTPIHAIPNFS